ncbi:MAG: hypothetical protein ACOX3P_02885 [Saccharofermentanales bacterium]|jgi:hypothetical protein|nr:hypothetical protein [Bacillota bacterium]
MWQFNQGDLYLTKRRSWWFSGLAGLLILLLLLFVGCDNILERIIPERAKNNDAQIISLGTESAMSSLELAQSLVLAVKPNNTEAVYNSIPRMQIEGVDKTDFHQYVQALHRGLSGTITGIQPLSGQDKRSIIALLEAGNPQVLALAKESDFYLLAYGHDTARSGGFVVAIQKRENGQAYLDPLWMKSIVSINNYMRLYFEAIESRNFASLDSLLRTGIKPRSELEEAALNARCQATLDFYHHMVRAQSDQYDLIAIYPGYAQVEQYAVTKAQHQKISRLVSFQEVNNKMVINDPVSVTLDRLDLTVKTEDGILFALDTGRNDIMVTSAIFDRLLGTPLAHDDNTCYRTSAGKNVFTIEYPGIIISAVGSCKDEHQTWSGRLTRAEIFYSNYELGSGLKPGLDINELYIRYPFARENNYLIQSQIEGKTYTLAVQVESGTISKLTITIE